MMSIQISSQVHPDHVHVIASGAYEHDSVLKAFDKAFEIAAAADRQRILFDGLNVEGPPPTTLQRYEIGVKFAGLQVDQYEDTKLAIVANSHMLDEKRFGETVGRNRGANGRVFADVEAALQWLLSG